MADTTTTLNPTPRAGQIDGDPAGYTNQANLAPADQSGYDPLDVKWASEPGAAARANGYPRIG